MKPLRVAVIGAGHMGRYHVEKVRLLAEREGAIALAAVVDLDLGRAQVLADSAGVPAARDFRGIGAAVDAAIVAVPTVAHFEVVESLLDAGVDVLVEKPIAASLLEAEKLLATAQERGRVLQVGHLEWFNAAMQRVAGAIRRPRFIEAHRMGPFPARATDVDVVRDLMIHDLDIVLRLVGADPSRVEAIGVPIITDRVDIANARLTFPGGCVANLTASRVTPTPMRKIRFFQPDGYFSIDFLAQDVTIAHREAPDATGERRIHLQHLEIDRGDALMEQLRSFVRACRDRVVTAGAGGEGLSALRLAMRVIEAMPDPEALQ